MDELEDIVANMVKGGESEENIALVIKNYKPKEPPSVMDVVNAGAAGILRGSSQAVSQPLKLAGALAEWTGLGPENNMLTQAGQAVEDFSNYVAPYHENVNDTYQQVAQGVGQVAPIVATMGTSTIPALAQTATKATSALQATGNALAQVGKRAVTAPGIIGGSMSAVPEWEAAKLQGASDDEAFKVLVANYLVGQTEVLPIQNVLSRLNTLTGGTILNAVRQIGAGGLEEAIQEGVQTYLANEIASASYDPDRDPLFQVLESAKVGGIVGMILPGIATVIHKLPAAKQEKIRTKIDELQSQELKVKTPEEIIEPSVPTTGSPELDAKQDEIFDTPSTQPTEEVQPTAAIQPEVAPEPANAGIPSSYLASSFEQTPEYIEADNQVRQLADEIRNEPTLEKTKALQEAIQARDNARIAFEEKASKPEKQEKVLVNPATMLKEQIRTHYKGVAEGVKKGQKDVNEKLITKVQDALKATDLSNTQVNSILNKVKKTNLFTPGSFSRLNSFIDNVVSDAKYSEKYDQAVELRSKIDPSKFPAAQRKLVQRFKKVNPEELPLDEYISIADEVYRSKLASTSNNYKPVEMSAVESFTNRAETEAKNKRNQELSQEFGDIEGMSEVEISQLMDDDSDPYQVNADTSKKLAIRDKLNKLVSYSSMGLEGASADTPAKNTILGKYKNIDTSKLSDKELKQYVKDVDNIILNDDYSGTGWIWAKGEAIEGAERIGDIKAKKLPEFTEGLRTASAYERAQFGLSKDNAKVSANSGMLDVMAGAAKADLAKGKIETGYRDLVSKLNKKYGGNARTQESIVRQAVGAYLSRYKGDPSVDLQNKKANIEKSIQAYQISDPELAKTLEKVYRDLAGAKDQNDVMDILKKKDIKSHEIIKYFQDMFAGKVDEFAENTEVFFNQPFVREENYTPVKLKAIDPRQITFEQNEELERQAVFTDPSRVKNVKMAGSAIEANNTIPDGFALDLDFALNMVNKYRQMVYDIETSRHRMRVKEFMKLDKAKSVFGDNLKRVQTIYNNVESENRGNSNNPSDGTSKALNKVIGSIRKTIFTTLFGAPTKFITQYAPGAFNSMVQLGDPNLFFQAKPGEMKELLKMYPIGVRGERMGGTDFGDKIYAATKLSMDVAKSDKYIVQPIRDLSEFMTKPFVKGDTNLATRAWSAFYIKYLQDKGIQVDPKTEHQRQDDPIRKEAAAYAETQTETAFGPNLQSRNAEFFKNRNELKDIFLPLSNYSFNMKDDMLTSWNYLFTGNEGQKKEAAQRLAGRVVEVAMYSALTYWLLRELKIAGADELRELFGLEPPTDEEKEERDKLTNGMMMGSIASELNPFIVGDFMGRTQAQGINMLAYYLSEESEYMSYKQWEEEVGEPLPVFEHKDGVLNNLGLYSVPVRNLDTITEASYKLDEENNTLEINGELYHLTDEQVRFLKINGWIQTLQTAGIGVPELSQMMQSIRTQERKRIKENGQ